MKLEEMVVAVLLAIAVASYGGLAAITLIS
jgi:hypothetical protein